MKPHEEEWVVDRLRGVVRDADGDSVALVSGEDEGHVGQRATLIAAAPDMALALTHVMGCQSRSGVCGSCARVIRAALVKARVLK